MQSKVIVCLLINVIIALQDVSTERSTPKSQRIADRECQKILHSSDLPLGSLISEESATLGELPYMVALGYDHGDGYEFNCGGSIVSKDYVLTAAHCVDTPDRIEPSVVRTGVVELGGSAWDDETDVGISQIIKHPGFTRREKYHDLALLRLNKSLSFTSNLNAACLETSDAEPALPLFITGWGQTSKRNTKRILLKVSVIAVPNDKCAEFYNNWRTLPQGLLANQLCAGDPEGLKDTCQGSAGGPLQSIDGKNMHRVVGVTSFGRGCVSPVPRVYTRVAKYLDWIESVVWHQ